MLSGKYLVFAQPGQAGQFGSNCAWVRYGSAVDVTYLLHNTETKIVKTGTRDEGRETRDEG